MQKEKVRPNRKTMGRNIIYFFAALLCLLPGASAVFADAPDGQTIPPLPDSPPNPAEIEKQEGYNNAINDELAQMKNGGYISIPEEHAKEFTLERVKPHLKSLQDISPGLLFNPSKISAPELSPPRGYIGVDPIQPGSYISIIQVFEIDGNILVMLEETDLKETGTQARQDPRMINTSINNIPAIVTVRRSPSDFTLIMLSWLVNERLYQLTVAGKNKNKVTKELALRLAHRVSS